MSAVKKTLSAISRFLPLPGRIQRFYESRTGEDLKDAGYLNTDSSAVNTIIETLRPLGLSEDDTILEIGCNAGRNLEVFRRSGFSKLTGVEINPAAISLMQREFPELHAVAETFAMPIQQASMKMKGRRFDLVYTCAVLQHIDRDWSTARQAVADLTGRHLLIVEVEHPSEKFSRRGYVFRSYKDELEECGFREIRYIDESETARLNRHYDGYMIRAFERIDE